MVPGPRSRLVRFEEGHHGKPSKKEMGGLGTFGSTVGVGTALNSELAL